LARLHDIELRVLDDLKASITNQGSMLTLSSSIQQKTRNFWERPFPSWWSTKLPSGCASLTIRKFDEKESY